MPQRRRPAATARWRQWEKPERMAWAGMAHTRSLHQPPRCAHGLRDHALRGLGDPVTWYLTSTGRRDGGWVGRAFQMAQYLADHLPLRDDGDEPQRPLMAPRAGGYLQVKDPPQETGTPQ